MILKTFLKNWSLLTVSSIVQQGANFFALVLLARRLARGEYGEYVYILTAVGIAQIVALLGLREIVIRQVARFPLQTRILARRTVPLVSLSSVLAGASLLLYLAKGSSVSSSIVLGSAILLVASQSLGNVAEALAFGRQTMGMSAMLNIVSALVWVGFIMAVPRELFNVSLAIAGFASIQSLRTIAYWCMEWSKGYFLSMVDEARSIANVTTKELTKQSLPILTVSVLTIPVSQLPILFLGQLSGMSEVGYFGLGSRLVMPFSLLASTLLSVIYPHLARLSLEHRERFTAICEALLFGLTSAGIGFSILVSSVGKEMIVLFFGDNYAAATTAFSIQSWITVNLILHSFLGFVLLALNLERLLMRLSIINAVLSGTAGFIGGYYGATGLSIALWCSLFLGLCIHVYYVAKNIGIIGDDAKGVTLLVSYAMMSIVSSIIAEQQIAIRSLVNLTTLILLMTLTRRFLSKFFRTLKLALDNMRMEKDKSRNVSSMPAY